jgi:hypothetical protein
MQDWNGIPGQWWFGGGTDITPAYVDEEDMRHFHGTYKVWLSGPRPPAPARALCSCSALLAPQQLSHAGAEPGTRVVLHARSDPASLKGHYTGDQALHASKTNTGAGKE